MNVVRIFLIVLLAGGGAAGQSNQTRSFEAVEDTTLSESAPATNYGTSATDTADGGSGTNLVTLLKWDLSAIPSGSVVISAKIDLHVVNASSEEYELYRMVRDWKEDEATWNDAEAGVPWTGPGASLDRGGDVRGQITAGSMGPTSISLNDLGVTAVQAWVDGPSVNYGFILVDGANTDGLAFASREAAATGERPKLTVTFMAPSSASASQGFCGATGMEALLLLALIALIRRNPAKN